MNYIQIKSLTTGVLENIMPLKEYLAEPDRYSFLRNRLRDILTGKQNDNAL